ncbi:recombinase family protein [Clostridium sp.]|uniref:recombinase family protein n=1 Tax=Clostridium sp. TaxID=1506 RepID=UPI002FC8CB8A
MDHLKNAQSNTRNSDVAAIYARVSTSRQSKKGYSLENQIEQADKFAENKYIIPDELIFIEDSSASKFYNREIDYESEDSGFINRVQLQRLIHYAKKNKFKHLLVYTRDRLSRVVEESLQIESMLKKCGVEIHYTKKGESLNSENENINRFLHLILSSVAELESSVLSTRVKEGNKSCIEKGLWAGGRIPIGYIRKAVKGNHGKVNSRLVKSEFERKVIEEVFKLYQVGLGYERIANRMNEQHGYISWTKGKVEAIIKNETYTGNVAWNRRGGRRNPIKHEDIVKAKHNSQLEIINKINWNEVVKLRKEREENPDPYLHQTPFILKDKLYCEICKKKMLNKNPGKNKKPVYYCDNENGKHDKTCYHRMPIDKVETAFFQHINKLISNKMQEYSELYYYYEMNFNERKSSNESFLQELKKRIGVLKEKNETMKKLIVDEKSNSIQKAIKSQIIYNENILVKYEEVEKRYESLIKKPLIMPEAFEKEVNNFINKIFLSQSCNYDNEFDSVNKPRFAKRNFIIHFIDKVYVSYNKQLESVTISTIELL